MSKTCLCCGKELRQDQQRNKYCSIECANKARTDNKIAAWLNGEFNGIKGTNQLSSTIRNYLLEKANYKCQRCGWGEINPTTQKVPLDIHHKDGNYMNNTKSNLEVLCPNCHSLTPNYKALNASGREDRIQSRKNYCIDCGAPITAEAIRCRDCANKARIVEKPVTREELKDKIRTSPFTTIAKEFNVSDNAIRKWCEGYGLPTRKKDIKAYSDEEWALI